MSKTICTMLIVWLAAVWQAKPETYFVATNGVDTRTGTGSWDNAVLTISNAVAKADAENDVVLISNGVYVLTAQIDIPNQIIVRSWNNGAIDPTNTIVNGNYPTATNTCFLITGNAELNGFTITNGCNTAVQYPGGVRLDPGTLQNCIITGNRATNGYGGGVQIVNGIMANCTISANTATNSGYGGGVHMADGTIQHCTIIANLSPGAGGVYALAGVIQNCEISYNSSDVTAGGAHLHSAGASYATIQNSVIANNEAGTSGGGIYITGTTGGTIRNCLIISNSAGGGVNKGGGGVGMNAGGTVQNCTISYNSTTNTGTFYGGGCFCYGGSPGGVLENTIIYFNTGTTGSNYYNRAGGSWSSYSNCCFSPALADAGVIAKSSNNITADPQFVEHTSGNYRLIRSSQCVNHGTFRDWMTEAVDLDGSHRIDIFTGIVDIGCYEYVSSGTMFSIK